MPSSLYPHIVTAREQHLHRRRPTKSPREAEVGHRLIYAAIFIRLCHWLLEFFALHHPLLCLIRVSLFCSKFPDSRLLPNRRRNVTRRRRGSGMESSWRRWHSSRIMKSVHPVAATALEGADQLKMTCSDTHIAILAG
ncbi:hypothetical protein NDU88_007693 [Pleurodeles waltl]|uniref:Uncharacterized protein n=1 Tax=Pleurodeles waltl TaxID=8319 RepID=A0AAV7RUT5_PLEWA|nr:hypothetical protein NDU88_007693 [Pleurodeles waltl]